MPYGISLQLPGQVGQHRPMQDVVVAPGELKDVGDVRLQGSVAITQPAAVKPADTPKKRLRGQVIGPDQKPVDGARVWLGKPFFDKWTPVAKTDEQGAFQLDVEASALREALAKDSKFAIRVAATAEGLGFAWTDVGSLNAENGELPSATLRMVEDLPVEGRILKEDGQPAAGVTAHVLHIRQPSQPTLDEYIRAARKDGAGFHTFHDNTWDGNVPGRTAAVTDAEGRFRMTGVGAERLALLSLKGAAIHNWWIVVATRGVPDDEADRKASGTLHLAAAPYDNHYYARFTHVSEPARTLQGVVRDRETGEPVAGVEVRADFNTSVVATTGADGRFELVGSRKAGSYNLKAKATAGGYFLREVSIADKPGIEPLACELEMVKGIAARGRVTDRETGQPVGGTVDYYPLFPNPFTSRLGDIAIPCSTSPIDKDGAYELEVLPGPGVIVVRNYDKKYAPARIDLNRIKEILEGVEPWGIGNNEEVLATAAGGQALGVIMRVQFKALAPIKPDDGAATLDQNLELVPGRTIKGVVLGPDGRPLAGVLASGTKAEFGPAYAMYEKLSGAEFAVECVTPDEARTVLFYHPEQKLGAKLEIARGYEGTLEVQLQACATAAGRLLDGGGKPVREATVVMTHKTSRVQVEEVRTWTAMTNGDGVFRVEGLIPGVEYSAATNGKSLFSAKLAPGEVRELGDIKVD